MTGPNREIRLDEIPFPPLFQLANDAGENVFQETLIGGEPAMVGAIFSSRELVEEFSENATEFGMPALSDLEAGELPDRSAVEAYADSGQDYVLVVTESGTGLFHASDVAAWAADNSDDPQERARMVISWAKKRGAGAFRPVPDEYRGA